MTLKFSHFLSVFSVAFIASCGGGSSSSDTTTFSSESTITVLDGYLSSAQVYNDSNYDGIATDDEILGITDSNGEFVLTETQSEIPILVKVIAGESSDSDRVGIATRSYTMAGEAGSSEITPFTTLAYYSDYSVDDIADQFNLNNNHLASDFIELKSSSSSYNSASTIHAVSRSLADNLATMGGELNVELALENLSTQINAIDDYINDNGYDALNTVTFRMIDDSATLITNYTDLGSYLGGNSNWYVNNLNARLQAENGGATLAFDTTNKQFTIYDSYGVNLETRDYLIDGESLVSTGGETDTLLALLPEFAINFSLNDDALEIWSTTDYSYPFESELLTSTQFAQNTWYLIIDESDNSNAELSLVSLSFNPLDNAIQGDVTASNNQTTYLGSYYVTLIENDDLGTVAPLYLHFDQGIGRLELVKVTTVEDLDLLYDLNTDRYVLLTDDANLANYIIDSLSQ